MMDASVYPMFMGMELIHAARSVKLVEASMRSRAAGI